MSVCYELKMSMAVVKTTIWEDYTASTWRSARVVHAVVGHHQIRPNTRNRVHQHCVRELGMRHGHDHAYKMSVRADLSCMCELWPACFDFIREISVVVG